MNRNIKRRGEKSKKKEICTMMAEMLGKMRIAKTLFTSSGMSVLCQNKVLFDT